MKPGFLRRLLGSVLASLMAFWPVSLALAASPAVGEAAAVSTFTETWHQATDTFIVFGSCADRDGVYQITIVANGAVHITRTEEGVHFSLSETGDFYLLPVEAAAPTTFSGHYATHLQFNRNENSVTWIDVFADTALGSDGTRETFRITYRLTLSASGFEREVESVNWICH